ncbi:MAG: HNH endonuclease [Nitrospiraceae bacterium]|nr:HNH endonuclease [Nitrospiraceae bacterium]
MPGTLKPKKYGELWSREELILAFGLYCRIPFKNTKANNPAVIELAKLLHRSPASVVRKLGNFGSFDPALQIRQVTGLVHSSKLDREVWDEFHDDWNKLVLKERELRDAIGLQPKNGSDAVELFVRPQGPSEKSVTRKARIHQLFFRDAILSSYEDTCCITGLGIRECLIASHIIPWSTSENLRADPHNGLCLSATFDRLFDSGLITITHDLFVVVSKRLRNSSDKRTMDLICQYHGAPITLPRRFLPMPEHLKWHQDNIFQG